MGIITLIVVGLIAGALARLLVPGKDSMGIVATLLLGLVGSLIGGFLGFILLGHDITEGAFQASGLIGSVIGAVVALLVYRALSSRRHHA